MDNPEKTEVDSQNTEMLSNHPRGRGTSKFFAIFIDYLNIDKNVKTPADIVFSALINPIVAEGRIVWIFVYIPESCVDRAPLNTLINRYQVIPILCTQEMGLGILKDKDTVDFMMDKHIRSIVERTDITDIVIVSGDADFYPVAVWAHQQGVRIHIQSAKSALAKTFADDSRLDVTTI